MSAAMPNDGDDVRYVRTQVGAIAIYFDGALREETAANVAALVERYARLAGVVEIPPVTLGPPSCGSSAWWNRPWEEIRQHRGFFGDAGASYEESARDINYRALYLAPNENPHPSLLQNPVHAKDIEGTIAHEMTHLRWWNLRHGPEFWARVRALLRGAVFPRTGSGWSRSTRAIMRDTRAEVAAWMKALASK